ncbi:MAG: barstar family protein [Nitrosomonadales bacterium]|nr:barstar family protein [Nitrosomonadales bacterium]
MLDKPAFIAAIAHTIHAPAGFGGNWDALADALQDLSWQPAAAYELVLCGTSALSADEQAIADEIFGDTARFWQAQGKSFQVKYAS